MSTPPQMGTKKAAPDGPMEGVGTAGRLGCGGDGLCELADAAVQAGGNLGVAVDLQLLQHLQEEGVDNDNNNACFTYPLGIFR